MQLCAKFYSIPLLNIIAYGLALLTFPYIGYVRRRVMKEFLKPGTTGAEVGVWKGEFSKFSNCVTYISNKNIDTFLSREVLFYFLL